MMAEQAQVGGPWELVFRSERLLADEGPMGFRSLAEELVRALRATLFQLERELQGQAITKIELGHARRETAGACQRAAELGKAMYAALDERDAAKASLGKLAATCEQMREWGDQLSGRLACSNSMTLMTRREIEGWRAARDAYCSLKGEL